MASTADLPEAQLRDFLDSLGLLGPFTVDSDNFDAPIVQLGFWEELEVPQGDRILSILKRGDNDVSNGFLNRDLNMAIVFAGNTSQGDAINVNARTQEIVQTLLDNFTGGCIFDAKPTEPVGPFISDSGRMVYEIPIRVLINRN